VLYIFCINVLKQYYANNNVLRPIYVFSRLQRTGFHRSGQIHLSKRQYFIRSKNCFFFVKFTTIRDQIFFVQVQSTETVLKMTNTVPASLVSRVSKFIEAKKYLLPSSSGLSLVNFLLRETLRQNLYRKDFRDPRCWSSEARLHVLQCWVR